MIRHPALVAGALVLVAATLCSAPAGARDLRYACVCAGTPANPDCPGNGGIAGRHGQVHADVPANQVLPFYTPGTGWACLPEASYECGCVGREKAGCGNGAVVGVRGEVRRALSLGDVLENYGPGLIGRERTGWACIPVAIPTPR